MQKRGLIVIGLTLTLLSMLMIGKSEELDSCQPYFGTSFFIYLGLCIYGLSSGLVSIPVLPEMLESIEQDKELAD